MTVTDYPHPDDHTTQSTVTPRFNPFTANLKRKKLQSLLKSVHNGKKPLQENLHFWYKEVEQEVTVEILCSAWKMIEVKDNNLLLRDCMPPNAIQLVVWNGRIRQTD